MKRLSKLNRLRAELASDKAKRARELRETIRREGEAMVKHVVDRLNAVTEARPKVDPAEHTALVQRLQKQVKFNELFERLIAWRRSNPSATVGDMTMFYADSRASFDFTPAEAENIEKAVETLYCAEKRSEREIPLPSPPTFWQKLGSIFLDTH